MEFQEKRIGYLYEVGVQGGIRRAADRLGINPSVISRQIALLERALQLPLLERRGRNVVLTEAGKLLADDYLITRTRREKLARHLSELRYMQGGVIHVRVGQGMIHDFVQNVMTVFSRTYPDVFVDISSGDFQTTLTLVASGKADMAVSFGPIGNPEIKRYSFRRGPICAVMSPQHPLAERESLTIAELANWPLIGVQDSFGLQRYINAMFQSEGLVFTPCWRSNLFSTAMELSMAGLGIAFMTPYALGDHLTHASLKAVPVDHPVAQQAECHLLRSADRRFTPAAHALWRLLHQHYGRASDAQIAVEPRED